MIFPKRKFNKIKAIQPKPTYIYIVIKSVHRSLLRELTEQPDVIFYWGFCGNGTDNLTVLGDFLSLN